MLNMPKVEYGIDEKNFILELDEVESKDESSEEMESKDVLAN